MSGTVTVVGFGRRFRLDIVHDPRLLLTNWHADYIPDLKTGICTSADDDGFQVRLCPSALRRLRRFVKETFQ